MSKKLVIRVNNLKDIQASDDYKVTEETEIRWDRVIAASSIALLLFVLLMVGVWYLFNAEELSNEMPLFEAASEPVVEDSGSQPVESQGAELSAAVASTAEALSQSDSIATQNSTPPVVAETALVKDESSVIDTANSVKPVNKAAPATPPETKLGDTPSEPAPVIALKEEASSKTIAFVDPIEVKSNRIVKAQLTHTVNKNEPVEQLGDSVSMNGDKLIKVYLFTGLEGLKGETLYHDWYLSGKKMARVKINVRSNKTSASSSKYIDQYMTGDWRVKVSTSKGDELVSANFNVTR